MMEKYPERKLKFGPTQFSAVKYYGKMKENQHLHITASLEAQGKLKLCHNSHLLIEPPIILSIFAAFGESYGRIK